MHLIESDKSILNDYSKVPILFKVEAIYEVIAKDDGFTGYDIVEKALEIPYIKDYDKKKLPVSWVKRFDTVNWGFFVIYDGKKPVAAATTVFDSPEICMLDGRNDITVLWDIRVHPDYRSQGLGKWLIDKTKEWAEERNCKYLKIETQNTNAKACKFYSAMGAKLDGIRKNAYTGEESQEIQFLWYIDLS